jgi:acyl phosphate:glycerol-3-phosphate acyltransferase
MQSTYFVIFIISVIYYLIGSIPTAYLALKLFHEKDITKEGSGNVGAMNSYDVSGSKKTGILVFVIDFLKGLIPAVIPIYFLDVGFSTMYIPLAALVAGHNFSIWLKFKGGRGLATAAGILAIVNFWVVIIWCVVYLIVNMIKKNVHIANTVATILMPIMLIVLNLQWKSQINLKGFPADITVIFCVLLSFIILLKHISPILSLIKES